MTSRIAAPTTDEFERRAAASHIPGVAFVTSEESCAMFDDAVRELMHMSGEEFTRRWNAGEYAEIVDKAEYRHILHLGSFVESFNRANS